MSHECESICRVYTPTILLLHLVFMTFYDILFCLSLNLFTVCNKSISLGTKVINMIYWCTIKCKWKNNTVTMVINNHITVIKFDIKLVSKVKLATIVEGDPKAPFSIATTPRCRGGRYSIPRIAPLYPWTIPYNAEC